MTSGQQIQHTNYKTVGFNINGIKLTYTTIKDKKGSKLTNVNEFLILPYISPAFSLRVAVLSRLLFPL